MVDRSAWHELKAKIPGWFAYAKTYDRAVADASDGATFVEVGSWKGRSAYYMALRIKASGKRIRFCCVDHWQGSAEHQSDPDVRGGRLYETFLRNIADVREFVEPMRMASLEAARHFENASCDLVMIDAAHDYDSVMADIAAWWPKVKPGGMLAGDDYHWPDVARAVAASFGDRAEVIGKADRQHWRIVKDGDAAISSRDSVTAPAS
jgi:predicted O-methyltransferase YrrM